MNETNQLIIALCITAETTGNTLSDNAATAMANDLANYPAEAVAAALHDCRHTLKGRLTLAAIIERIHADDGHPPANEAWAIALDATDEYKTVLMTAHIQEALDAARPVLNLGDNVGARMAFLATYERLIAHARKNRQKAVWNLSLGFDAKGREPARQAAIESGRLALETSKQTLCLTQESGFNPLPQQADETEKEKAKANIKKLRAMVDEVFCNQHLAKQKQAQRQRVNLYLLKRQQRKLFETEQARIAALQSRSKQREAAMQGHKEASA